MRARILILLSCLAFFSSQVSKAACTYSLAPASASFGIAGGSNSFSVTASKSTCAWTAATADTWLHTTSSGSGNGTVTYTVDTNGTGNARSGTITAGGQTFTVTQTGPPPTLASALDTSNLVWVTSTNYPWQVENNVTHDGVDAAVSGNKFVPNSVSWVQTTVTGPGIVGFWWKVDSDVTTNTDGSLFSFDDFEFLIDGDQPDHIMGQIDWNYREFPVPAGSHTLTWQYVKDAQFNSGNDSAWLDQVSWSPGSPISLATALDTCGVPWDSDGTIPTYWAGQTNVTHDGKSAARSGTIYLSQETWMQTVVSGVSNVSFWWKVSCQTNFDFLEFYTNDILAKRISGEVNWQSNFFKLPFTNSVSLKWRYVMTNGIYAAQGQEAAWVDQVVFSPSNSAAPIVTLLGSNPMTVECHGSFTDPGATAQDGCSGTTLTVTTNGLADPNVLGAYSIKYVATAAGVSTTNSRTVNVVDTTPPQIAINGASPITVECHGSFTDPGASALDICAGALSVVTNNSVNLNTPGGYIIQYVATDPSGNSSTNSRTVNVVDTTAPQLSLNGVNPMTVECHAPFIDPGASAIDACAGTLSIVTNSSLNSNLPGAYVIQYVATDPSGNSSTNSRTVNVVDTTPPQISLNGANPMTVECHSSFTDPGASALDLCAGALGVSTNGAVNPNLTGTYTIQYVATDPGGNSSTNTRTVNVVDTTPPQVTVNGNNPMTVECHGSFTDPGATALDACAGALSVSTNGSVNANLTGAYTIRYIATDPTGNSSTNMRTVNVVDTTPPQVTLNGANPMTVECHGSFTDPGATAVDLCAGALNVSTNGAVNPNLTGTYTIQYVATDPSRNSSTNMRTINVVDTTPPQVTLNGANPMTVECHSSFTDPGATAVDLCAGALSVSTNGAVNPNLTGNYTIQYVATDSSGNSATNSRTVNVVDTTPPQITLNGNNPMTVECHSSFTEPGATAMDACAGALSVTTNGTVNANLTGTYTIQYVATDPSGNSSTNTRTVNVVDTTPPQITLNGNNPMTVECHGSFTDPGATAVDLCAGGLSVSTNSAVNPDLTGTYTIQYVATDPSGNSATNSRTVNVVDTAPPQIALNGNNPMTIECHGVFTDPGASAMDACAGVLSVTTNGSVNPNLTGAYVLEYVAIDPSGNSTTNTRTVNVVDTTPPTIQYYFTNLFLSAGANCQVSLPDLTGSDYVVALDNCSSVTVTQTPLAATMLPLGTNQVVLTACDTSGNKTPCTNFVIVVDTTPPSLVCPLDLIVTADPGHCSATNVLLGDPTVSDTCSGTTVINDAPSVFPVGTNLVTWTATDGQGNITNGIQLVIIEDTEPPIITAPANLSVLADPGTNHASAVSLGSPVASDNCGVATVTNDAPTVFPLGTNLVTWTCTDIHGNSAEAQQQVVVTPAHGPHRITSIVRNSNGTFTLNFLGVAYGQYIVQVSSNLLNWLPAQTNTAGPDGTWSYLDSTTSGLSRRFYRSIQP